MNIIHRNAEALLFAKANAIGEHPNSWRAIHLFLSEQEAFYNQTLLTCFLIRELNKILSDDDGAIYLCKDGDIVILFQGAVKPLLTKLSQTFADINPTYREDNHDNGFYTVFDLSTSWSDFLGLCYLKSMTADKPAGDAIHRYRAEQQAAELVRENN